MADEENNFKNKESINYCQSAVDLQNCLHSILEKILKNVSDQKFIQIYKNCYKGFEKKSDIDKPALSGSSVEAKKYHSQFNSMIKKNVFAAIEETINGMNNKLKELEELKKEQRPPGNALKHIIPFEYVSLSTKKEELESCIKREQEALKLLKARLMQKRIKAQQQHLVLLESVSDIEKSVFRTTKI
ncbi:hypothetical protein Phum_PHUM592880 [Pediculus humanus corporis]|uniref:Uncharacterized protein n=1 Tax=Pediculus humanus subsp. corporis TaxID=121224 RepID=E0W2H6_PEDHC|nr:uncharacterized protein Phum_PHUM592880 [Pediculus humanus corporis]EEB19832.1 hypothetical protein Phum_PHUM592880 [Pediculus humanus corporis]